MPINVFELNVNIKTVSLPYSRIVRNVKHKMKIYGFHPRPGNQTTEARHRAADHSLSSTDLNPSVTCLTICRLNKQRDRDVIHQLGP